MIKNFLKSLYMFLACFFVIAIVAVAYMIILDSFMSAYGIIGLYTCFSFVLAALSIYCFYDNYKSKNINNNNHETENESISSQNTIVGFNELLKVLGDEHEPAIIRAIEYSGYNNNNEIDWENVNTILKNWKILK